MSSDIYSSFRLGSICFSVLGRCSWDGGDTFWVEMTGDPILSTLFQNVLNNLFYVICADILSVKKCTNVTKKHTNSFQRPTFAKSRNRAQTVNRKSRWEVSRNRNEVFVV